MWTSPVLIGSPERCVHGHCSALTEIQDPPVMQMGSLKAWWLLLCNTVQLKYLQKKTRSVLPTKLIPPQTTGTTKTINFLYTANRKLLSTSSLLDPNIITKKYFAFVCEEHHLIYTPKTFKRFAPFSMVLLKKTSCKQTYRCEHPSWIIHLVAVIVFISTGTLHYFCKTVTQQFDDIFFWD